MNQPSELSCSISIFQLQTVAPIRRYPIETRVGAFQISKFPTASSYHDSEHTGAGPLELMTDPVRMARQDLFSFKMRYRISLPCFPFPSSVDLRPSTSDNALRRSASARRDPLPSPGISRPLASYFRAVVVEKVGLPATLLALP